METLSNDKITLKISEHGAELTSIIAGGKEYLWQGDPKFWARHSPILFPFVGRVWKNEYRHEGEKFTIGQHGFARDMDFLLIHEDDSAVIYSLRSNEETLEKYPFPFILEIGYKLNGNQIEVIWNVQNIGNETMYFQIGAHPAFYYRNFNGSDHKDVRGFLDFGKEHSFLEYISPVEQGCASDERHKLQLTDGIMEITTNSFDCDTYIFDNRQLKKITLTDKQKQPYLSLTFDTPIVAVWSPSNVHPDVPFICIEPWYGRCDKVGYDGELKNRECIQQLAPSDIFHASYTITLEDIS